jgi:phosphatidate cytidylyltransferase
VKLNLGSDFARRIRTIVLVAPPVLALMLAGRETFFVLILLLTAICATEFYRMVLPDAPIAWGISLLIIFSPCITYLSGNNYWWFVVMVAIACVLAGIGAVRTTPDQRWRYAFLVIGALYIGVPAGLLMPIRDKSDGLAWIVVLVFNNWFTDGFALLGGRLFGRTHFAPRLSPKKTLEGLIIGVAVGFIVGVTLSQILQLSLNTALVANGMISLFTVTGDLIESWAKRTFNIKDSGTLLPGHGGFLDRVDGLVVAIVGLYAIFVSLGF